GRREERRFVRLGKLNHAPRVRRPLKRERHALKSAEIGLSLERPAVHQLAALLLHRRERQERRGGGQAGFLMELALSRGEQVFAVVRQALGDRPRTGILV